MQRDCSQLEEAVFDLAIIGGGITGAGVALDASLRGLKVALLEKNDFGSGTSGISSKLIHGGLRYLELGHFSLVYEGLRERGRLLRNAPHLIRPLQFYLPLFSGTRVPPWKWRIGLKLYDLLAGPWNIKSSHYLSPWELKQLNIPWKNSPEGCLSFFDAQMDDSRLCLEVMISAHQNGAKLCNHAEITALDIFPGRVGRIRFRDLLQGQEWEIKAKTVLNATGPWCDSIRTLAGSASQPLVKPTKGVHIVYPNFGLTGALLLLHPRDGRVFFVLPWKGRILAGTTDTDWSGDPSNVMATQEDIEYLREGIEAYLQIPQSMREPINSFAGLRPLVNSELSPSTRSREFYLHEDTNGLLSAAGGKFTSYRSMAEEITDIIARKVGSKSRCATHDFSLAGGYSVSERVFKQQGYLELKWRYSLNEGEASHLLGKYGKRAGKVAAILSQNARLKEPIITGFPDMVGEFLFHQQEEMAHLSRDFLFQRTRLGLLVGQDCLAQAKNVLHDCLGSGKEGL